MGYLTKDFVCGSRTWNVRDVFNIKRAVKHLKLYLAIVALLVATGQAFASADAYYQGLLKGRSL